MFNIFRRTTANQIANDQLLEAERATIEHEAAAEHHDALATMYRGRVERLKLMRALAEASSRQRAAHAANVPFPTLVSAVEKGSK